MTRLCIKGCFKWMLPNLYVGNVWKIHVKTKGFVFSVPCKKQSFFCWLVFRVSPYSTRSTLFEPTSPTMIHTHLYTTQKKISHLRLGDFQVAAGYNCEELLGDILAQSFEGTFVFRPKRNKRTRGCRDRREWVLAGEFWFWLVGRSEGVLEDDAPKLPKKKKHLAILPFKQSFGGFGLIHNIENNHPNVWGMVVFFWGIWKVYNSI